MKVGANSPSRAPWTTPGLQLSEGSRVLARCQPPGLSLASCCPLVSCSPRPLSLLGAIQKVPGWSAEGQSPPWPAVRILRLCVCCCFPTYHCVKSDLLISRHEGRGDHLVLSPSLPVPSQRWTPHCSVLNAGVKTSFS